MNPLILSIIFTLFLTNSYAMERVEDKPETQKVEKDDSEKDASQPKINTAPSVGVYVLGAAAGVVTLVALAGGTWVGKKMYDKKQQEQFVSQNPFGALALVYKKNDEFPDFFKHYQETIGDSILDHEVWSGLSKSPYELMASDAFNVMIPSLKEKVIVIARYFSHLTLENGLAKLWADNPDRVNAILAQGTTAYLNSDENIRDFSEADLASLGRLHKVMIADEEIWKKAIADHPPLDEQKINTMTALYIKKQDFEYVDRTLDQEK